MANPEHLAILKEGVKAWNEWRVQNPSIKPALGNLRLGEAEFVQADLSGADLCEANLSEANLISTQLREASLDRANLSGANLIWADLMEARLSGADLSGANLKEAHLTRADLSKARLIDVDLSGASLVDADLSQVDLSRARLIWTDLGGANLSEANLSEANLIGANLTEANLGNANARYCQLCGCGLTNAMLTGTKLYATARDGWIVNGVECKYVFWDADGEIRSPPDEDFAPGEFERIYKSLPTIEYVFQRGMMPLDLLIMDHVVQAIRGQNPEYDIRIDSISARGLAPSVKFTVRNEEHKERALADVTKVYEAKVHQLAGRLDEASDLIQRFLGHLD